MILESREERERERKRNPDVREKHRINRLPLRWAQTGTELTTQACALTGIEPATFWFIEQCSNQLSHTGQGYTLIVLKLFTFLKFVLIALPEARMMKGWVVIIDKNLYSISLSS